MELVILGLGKLLGSAGFGTVFGGVMGYFNRRADLEYKRLEYLDHDKQRAHELLQRKADMEMMKEEAAAKIQVAKIEGESASEREAFKALAASYDFAKPEAGSSMATFSSFVRPAISLGYFVISSAGAGYILYYAFIVSSVQLDAKQLFDLAMFVIDWVAFMSSTTIGYWFAMRAGAAPQPRAR